MGKTKWTSITTSKVLPRQSKELTDNINQYERFIKAWEPVFDWQNETVRFQFLQA